MTFSIIRRRVLLIVVLFVFVAASFANCLANQGQATLRAEDGKLVLSVNLPNPPPVNLITKLKFQATTRIISTSPEADKIDKKKSTIKWLIKNPQPGQLRLSVKTSPAVQPSSASAVVTYRKPGDGSLIKIQAVIE